MIAANISAIGAIKPQMSAPVPEPAPVRPGKSGMAVGQLAKQAVAAAREAGLDVPKNAQGVAASQIAKGASPESVFAAQTADETPAPDGPVEVPIDIDVPVVIDAPEVVEIAAPDLMTPPVEETALQLVQDAQTDRAMVAAAQYDLASTVIAASGDSSAQIALDLLS